MRSGPFTPAAATLIRTSDRAGMGSGRRPTASISGPPAAVISTAAMSDGNSNVCLLWFMLGSAGRSF